MKPSQKKIPTEMKIKNTVYDTTSQPFSNLLNKHFTKLGPNMANEIPKTNCHFTDFMYANYKGSFVLLDTDFDEVKAIINNLKIDTACGIDEISTRLIKLSSSVITPILVKLFNISFYQEKFPDILKLGQIVPIPKLATLKRLTDFRPISVLLFFPKYLKNYFMLE